MSFLKDYIISEIELPITDYMYINVDSYGYVEKYENFKKEFDGADTRETIDVFLKAFSSIIGFNSSKLTLIKKGYDGFSQNNYNLKLSNYNYSVCEIIVNKLSPIDYLLAEIPKNKDLFFINLTAFKEFNFLQHALTMQHIEMLDQFFQNEDVVRIYKKYNDFYILN